MIPLPFRNRYLPAKADANLVVKSNIKKFSGGFFHLIFLRFYRGLVNAGIDLEAD
jgi:hypothetical protein